MRLLRRLAFRMPALLLLGSLAAASASAALAAEPAGLLRLDGLHVKWGTTDYGAPAEVTYAYLAEAQSFPRARNCRSMLPLSLLLDHAGIGSAEFRRETRAAFDLWSAHADIRFREVEDSDEADILIGAQNSTRGVAFANIFRQDRGDGGIARITGATICLDPTESWEIGRDGNVATYTVRRVLAHEIGHALGLDHLGRDGGLMGYVYPEPATGPLARLTASDSAAIGWLYGTGDGVPAAGPVPAAMPPDAVQDGTCNAVTGEPHGSTVECALTPSDHRTSTQVP